MADFADFMTKWKPQVVTWNGRGFDLPVLALRGLRFGLDFGWYYRGEGYRYRFSEEGHLDLCDVLSDHGAAQDDVARRRGARHRPARQGRRRRQPGRGAVSRRPDRGAAPLLPVRRRADGVPVPALPAGRGRSSIATTTGAPRPACWPRARPTGASAGCSTASTARGSCSGTDRGALPALPPLPRSFYARPTVDVARELLGKVLVRRWARRARCGSRASSRSRPTSASATPPRTRAADPRPRAAIMFGPPGFLYVYLIYGMHHCMNFVTETDGVAGAVLHPRGRAPRRRRPIRGGR